MALVSLSGRPVGELVPFSTMPCDLLVCSRHLIAGYLRSRTVWGVPAATAALFQAWRGGGISPPWTAGAFPPACQTSGQVTTRHEAEIVYCFCILVGRKWVFEGPGGSEGVSR